jgi:hypothetical protein
MRTTPKSSSTRTSAKTAECPSEQGTDFPVSVCQSMREIQLIKPVQKIKKRDPRRQRQLVSGAIDRQDDRYGKSRGGMSGKPASATISAALIRSSSSSSTIRTTGRQSAKAIQIPSFAIAQVRGGASFRQPRPAAQDGSDPEIPAISSASCYGSGRPAPQPRLTEQIHALAI